MYDAGIVPLYRYDRLSQEDVPGTLSFRGAASAPRVNANSEKNGPVPGPFFLFEGFPDLEDNSKIYPLSGEAT